MVHPVAHAQVDLSVLYHDHAAAVYGMARRVCGRVLAEEVTQEVFLRYWSHPERFDPSPGTLRSFLLVMAHRRAVDALRSESARRRRSSERPRRRRGPPPTPIRRWRTRSGPLGSWRPCAR